MKATWTRRYGLAAAGLFALLLQCAVALAGPSARVCVSEVCGGVVAASPCCSGCVDGVADAAIAAAADCTCEALPLVTQQPLPAPVAPSAEPHPVAAGVDLPLPCASAPLPPAQQAPPGAHPPRTRCLILTC